MTPEYITIHNTANDASAANEISYMTGNSESTSYHFAVDDKEVIQGIPLTECLAFGRRHERYRKPKVDCYRNLLQQVRRRTVQSRRRTGDCVRDADF